MKYFSSDEETMSFVCYNPKLGMILKKVIGHFLKFRATKFLQVGKEWFKLLWLATLEEGLSLRGIKPSHLCCTGVIYIEFLSISRVLVGDRRTGCTRINPPISIVSSSGSPVSLPPDEIILLVFRDISLTLGASPISTTTW